jgi:hypothetical protein
MADAASGQIQKLGLEKGQMRSKPLRPSQRLAGIRTHKNQEKTGTFPVQKSRTRNSLSDMKTEKAAAVFTATADCGAFSKHFNHGPRPQARGYSSSQR